MAEYRNFPVAVPITSPGNAADGQVLIVGGVEQNSGSSGGKRLELYNPATLSFGPAGSMTTPREQHSATLIGVSVQ